MINYKVIVISFDCRSKLLGVLYIGLKVIFFFFWENENSKMKIHKYCSMSDDGVVRLKTKI